MQRSEFREGSEFYYLSRAVKELLCIRVDNSHCELNETIQDPAAVTGPKCRVAKFNAFDYSSHFMRHLLLRGKVLEAIRDNRGN